MFISENEAAEVVGNRHSEHGRVERSDNKTVKYVIAGLAVVCLIVGIAYYNVHNSCISAQQAWQDIGQKHCVKFNVGYTYTSWDGNTFLDQYQEYSSGFAVYMPAAGLGSQTDSYLGSLAQKNYLNKTIAVTGYISSYHGAPQIACYVDSCNIKIVN